MKKIIAGSRKSAVARVKIEKGEGKIVINGKDLNSYFPTNYLQQKVNAPLVLLDINKTFDLKVNVNGGGTTGQAEAIRHAVSHSLADINEEWKPILRKAGFITRDPRKVERQKPGQRGARAKNQWVKR